MKPSGNSKERELLPTFDSSLGGGKANLGMAFVGVLIMTGLSNGLNMIGVSPFYQYMVTGVALFIAVLIQSERRK